MSMLFMLKYVDKSVTYLFQTILWRWIYLVEKKGFFGKGCLEWQCRYGELALQASYSILKRVIAVVAFS